jgi:hypothetical protein
LGWAPRLTQRALSLAASLSLAACGTLIGLGDLEKADCVGNCSANIAGTAGVSAGGIASGGTFVYVSGSVGMSEGGKAGASVATGGTMTSGTAGSPNGGSAVSLGGTDSGGGGGEGPSLGVCPGGPEPAVNWTEHWFEHTQKLKRAYYDDCIALYFDADVTPTVQAWMVPFLDKAWTYSLSTYGKMGSERIYVVMHQGRYLGGHSATFTEDSHDNHAVIDMGLNTWVDGEWDLPAHLLSFLVDTEGSHTKFGAPKSEHYANQGFPLIYKYDLYLALGLDATAASALSSFSAISNSEPFAKTYWFRDWFYPAWRDHGHAQLFANYQTLLEKYYPVDADNWMPTMNYGQYFHFMSGAAGVDLVPLARTAFQWHPDFDDEIAAAKVDFPDIKY